jgi:hypothetical protein
VTNLPSAGKSHSTQEKDGEEATKNRREAQLRENKGGISTVSALVVYSTVTNLVAEGWKQDVPPARN